MDIWAMPSIQLSFFLLVKGAIGNPEVLIGRKVPIKINIVGNAVAERIPQEYVIHTSIFDMFKQYCNIKPEILMSWLYISWQCWRVLQCSLIWI